MAITLVEIVFALVLLRLLPVRLTDVTAASAPTSAEINS